MTIISDLAAWLASNGYEDLDAWMADSDYSCTRDTDDRIIGWADEDGNEVNPVDVATYAMEAAAAAPPTCILTAENIGTEDDCTTHDHEPEPVGESH